MESHAALTVCGLREPSFRAAGCDRCRKGWGLRRCDCVSYPRRPHAMVFRKFQGELETAGLGRDQQPQVALSRSWAGRKSNYVRLRTLVRHRLVAGRSFSDSAREEMVGAPRFERGTS